MPYWLSSFGLSRQAAASPQHVDLHCEEGGVLKTILLAGALALAAATLLPSAEIRKAPELAYTIPGKGQELLSQYRGKVVALEFILTTCPHCQAASRVMTQLQQEYGPRGFQALDLAINALDENRTPEQGNQLVEAFIANYQVGFPVGWVPRDSFLSFLGVSITEYMVVPQLVLIDRKGYIHYQTPARGDENSTKESVVRQRIEELLAMPATTAVRAPVRETRRPIGMSERDQNALGPLEAEIMEVLWTRCKCSVREVVQDLARPLAYTTVMTTLDRLFKKGLLARETCDRAFLYAPAVSREEWQQTRAGHWLSGFLAAQSTSGELLISCLVDAVRKYDETLLTELERQIALKRRELEGRGQSKGAEA